MEPNATFLKNLITMKIKAFTLIELLVVVAIIGALGQTRTGTPQAARILSPLCLPISPRGHELFSSVFMPIFIIEQDE